jgi:hypothetical protein
LYFAEDFEEPAPKRQAVSGALAALSRDSTPLLSLGEAIHESLATPLKTILSQGMTEDGLKCRIEHLKAPENLEGLSELPVNSEVWKSVQASTRGVDINLQEVHKTLGKGIIPIAKIASRLVDVIDKPDSLPVLKLAEEVLEGVTDGLALLCQADHQLNVERRRLIQPDLKFNYKDLAKKSNPVPVGQLFGDLAKQIRDLEETNRVVSTVTRPRRGQGRNIFRGRGRGAHNNSQNRFLGQNQSPQGQGYSNRGRQQYNTASRPQRGQQNRRRTRR